MVNSQRHYVFGYGSLIERESRLRTTPNAIEAMPAIIRGISRGWRQEGAPIGFSTTFLGAGIGDDESICNGVLYPATDDELRLTDKREFTYIRSRIDPAAVTMLDGSQYPPEGELWFYAMKQADYRPPTARHPIVQSYIDICMNGCLEIEDGYPQAKAGNFAELFITSTLDWSGYWVNDRLYPRRPFIYVPRAFAIDTLLQKNLPALFDQIQLEPGNWEN
jgi:cation transport regulator ChaC